jgi:hypothetical protein
MPTVPLTAWEQAAIVVIFCLLLVALFAGVRALLTSVYNQNLTTFTQFQKFLEKQDERWQEYFEHRENSFNDRNGAVVGALERISNKLDEHHAETARAIATMEERTRPRKNSTKKPAIKIVSPIEGE